MATLVDSLVSDFIKVVTNMVAEEIFKVLGVTKEIKVLQEKLETINGYLQKVEQKKHGNDEIDIWVRKLKDIMYDADDIIDLCMIKREKLMKDQALSGSSTVSISCNYLFTCCPCLKFRYAIANQIIALNTRLEDLKNNTIIKNNLDGATKVSVEYVNEGTTNEAYCHLEVEGDVVGTQIKTDAEILINWIINKNFEKCRVFGVVGTGGIGKSTLANKILYDEQIKINFPNRKWFDVSKNYIYTNMLKELIRLEKEGSETKEENLEGRSRVELEEKLISVLKQNTFIVLDDVWNSSVWIELLRKPIMNSVANCTVLVTCRMEGPVKLMKPTHIHPVDKMDVETGWDLLKHWAFKDKDEDEISNFKEIGTELVHKCGRLPLAIKAIGRILYQKNKAKWEEVARSDVWNMNLIKEELRPLYLSYDDLPFDHKKCFLYCSLYPQKNIYYKKIVQFWAAEGLCEQELKTMEDTGEEIYRELISRNLLEVDASSDLSKNYFSMHDHFRSLCENLLREEGILYRYGSKLKAYGNLKIRRLSVSDMGPKLVLPDLIIRQACLRTLILTDSPKTEMIEDSLLQALSCLRVLDLRDTSIQTIPDCIGNLLHLRYLDLDGTNICEIPMTIGNLVSLQTLNISRCRYLERLPVSITELHNLRWLNMINCPLLTYVPKGIGKLKKLCSLHGFMVGQNDSASEEGCELEELENLSELRGISIYMLQRAGGGASALAKMGDLKELTLGWMPPDDAKVSEEADGDDGNDDASGQGNESEERKQEEICSEEQINKAERICNEMTPASRKIFDLVFSEYPGRQFPSWMASSSLSYFFQNLTYLKLLGLPCCKELPPLGTLPELIYLCIERASAITAIGSQFLGSGRSAFRKLEQLRFKDMPAWEEWTFNGTPLAVKLFPSLKYCAIMKCPKLRALPDGLQGATNLEELDLSQTYELGEINNLTCAYRLAVTNGRGLKKISNIRPLRYLGVLYCSNLKCVENLRKLQHLVVTCSVETEQLPQWLRGLIEQHNNIANTDKSLKKFEMYCNLQLLKSCLEGNENWDIIKQIPDVKIQTSSGKEYMRYTKDPYIYDPHVPPD